MGEWINVKALLPDNIEDDENAVEWVLVWANGAMNCMMYSRTNGFYDPCYRSSNNIIIHEITHWRPLPPPPREDDPDLMKRILSGEYTADGE